MQRLAVSRPGTDLNAIRQIVEVEVPFERIVTVQVPVVSLKCVLFPKVLRDRAPPRTRAFSCLSLDHISGKDCLQGRPGARAHVE